MSCWSWEGWLQVGGSRAGTLPGWLILCGHLPPAPPATTSTQPAESASLPNQLQLQLETEVFRCWHQPALKNLLHPLLDAGRGRKVWEWEWGTVPIPNTDSVLFSNQAEVKLQTGSSQACWTLPPVCTCRAHAQSPAQPAPVAHAGM